MGRHSTAVFIDNVDCFFFTKLAGKTKNRGLPTCCRLDASTASSAWSQPILDNQQRQHQRTSCTKTHAASQRILGAQSVHAGSLCFNNERLSCEARGERLCREQWQRPSSRVRSRFARQKPPWLASNLACINPTVRHARCSKAFHVSASSAEKPNAVS